MLNPRMEIQTNFTVLCLNMQRTKGETFSSQIFQLSCNWNPGAGNLNFPISLNSQYVNIRIYILVCKTILMFLEFGLNFIIPFKTFSKQLQLPKKFRFSRFFFSFVPRFLFPSYSPKSNQTKPNRIRIRITSTHTFLHIYIHPPCLLTLYQ